jgi:hypothetical protein
MQRRLQSGPWTITRENDDAGALSLRAARDAEGIDGDVVADVSVDPHADGTRILLEFSPLPPTQIDGYDRWLEDQGIIVKHVAPEDYDDLRKR